VINEFDGLEFEFPGGGSITGDQFRDDQLKIDYDNSFKWAVIGINALLALVGLLFGCWVCENVRYDGTSRKVR
jgi:hypothetical protein